MILAGVCNDHESLTAALAEGRRLARQVILEVFTAQQALLAEAAGFDGLIVKGHEAGGFVSADSSFLLLQQLNGRLSIPFWLQGGIGPDTAAAALLGGAAGVVLGEQLWLAAESPFVGR